MEGNKKSDVKGRVPWMSGRGQKASPVVEPTVGCLDGAAGAPSEIDCWAGKKIVWRAQCVGCKPESLEALPVSKSAARRVKGEDTATSTPGLFPPSVTNLVLSLLLSFTLFWHESEMGAQSCVGWRRQSSPFNALSRFVPIWPGIWVTFFFALLL